jgi:hypothetical protein
MKLQSFFKGVARWFSGTENKGSCLPRTQLQLENLEQRDVPTAMTGYQQLVAYSHVQQFINDFAQIEGTRYTLSATRIATDIVNTRRDVVAGNAVSFYLDFRGLVKDVVNEFETANAAHQANLSVLGRNASTTVNDLAQLASDAKIAHQLNRTSIDAIMANGGQLSDPVSQLLAQAGAANDYLSPQYGFYADTLNQLYNAGRV